MSFFHKFISISLIALFGTLAFGCAGVPTSNPETLPTQANVDFSNIIVSLTFDDGDADNYLVRSVLEKDGFHATFYISSGLTGTEGFMTLEQLRGLYEDGNDIGGHTLDHVNLLDVRGAELKYEVCQDRMNLLGMGFDAVSFAYPFGQYDEEVIRVVEECGYNNARIVSGGPEKFPVEDRYTLNTMPYIVQNTGFQKMTRYLKDIQQEGGGWAIYVFHHVCDGCNKFAISYDTFVQFVDWLSYQQEMNGLRVQTVHEVIGGDVKPGVNP